MSTQVMSKQEFIDMLKKDINDNDHILISSNIDGTSEVMKKRKLKRLPFAFAANAFENETSLNDLFKSNGLTVTSKVPMFAVIVATDDIVADKFKHPKKPERVIKCYTCMDSKQVEGSRIGYDSIMSRCPDC